MIATAIGASPPATAKGIAEATIAVMPATSSSTTSAKVRALGSGDCSSRTTISAQEAPAKVSAAMNLRRQFAKPCSASSALRKATPRP